MKTQRPVGAGSPAPRTTDWRPDLEKEKPERRGVPEPTEDSLPSNGELASALRTIADYLAIEGESTFKILAYQRAADTFRDHPLSIAAMAREGSLRDIPGVGEAIQAKVAEYLERGTTTYLTEQRARYPGDILALTRLPGIGPKTVKKLWDHLGISSLDELRAAAENESIRTYPAWVPNQKQTFCRPCPREKHGRSASCWGRLTPWRTGSLAPSVRLTRR